jgi:hypothetical protein
MYKPLFKWLEENIPGGKFTFLLNFKYVYKSDGTRLEIPKEVYCGECPKKALYIYKSWPEQHPLPNYIVKNLFESWKEFEDVFTCPHDNDKIKLKRTFGRRSLRGFN